MSPAMSLPAGLLSPTRWAPFGVECHRFLSELDPQVTSTSLLLCTSVSCQRCRLTFEANAFGRCRRQRGSMSNRAEYTWLAVLLVMAISAFFYERTESSPDQDHPPSTV